MQVRGEGTRQGKALLSIMNRRHRHRYKYLMTFERHQQQKFTKDRRWKSLFFIKITAISEVIITSRASLDYDFRDDSIITPYTLTTILIAFVNSAA